MKKMLSDEVIKKSLSQNLIRLRGTRSMRSVAEEAGIAPIHLLRLERGQVLPNVGIAVRLAHVFSVPLDLLVAHPRRLAEHLKQAAEVAAEKKDTPAA